MSIHESLHYYNVGALARVPEAKLKVARRILFEKIGFMRNVAKQQAVCKEVYADIRKYEAVHQEINKLLSVSA
jgi:hypothetical protein